MTLRAPRVVLYGCGLMGRVIVRYLHEKGVDVVGAIDNNPELVGQDIGTASGIEPLGVIVSADAEAVLDETAPDVAVLTLLSLMADMETFLLHAVERGIDVVTTCEEAFHPWSTSPELTARLDAIARRTGATVLGTGYQDVFWGTLVRVAAGATHRIDTIRGYSSYNVDHYGIALANVHGVGLTEQEFRTQIAEANLPSFALNVPPGFVAGLGLTETSTVQELVPIVAEEPRESATLGRTIEVGQALGMTARVTTTTAEGPTIVVELVGKVYAEDEVDHNDWTIEGEPTTPIIVTAPDTVALTCATTVNRIPQVIAARPGVITTEELPPAAYLAGKLLV